MAGPGRGEVLLVTCRALPEGEPGAAVLDRALAARGVPARWVAWDDPAVAWQSAPLVAVRSTWDYDVRLPEFLAWAAEVGPALLNGASVFAWNTDKSYLVDLARAGLPVVPTATVASAHDLAAAVAAHRVAVVKPCVGAGGRGVDVVRRGSAYHPAHPGPWVVQPLVESVRTTGETSVFVLGGRAVSQVDKQPAAGEIRVHEHFGGLTRAVPLAAETAGLAVRAVAAAGRLLGTEVAYARADLMRYNGGWVVSELELTEPGLYLDVLPGNAAPFADLLVARLGC